MRHFDVRLALLSGCAMAVYLALAVWAWGDVSDFFSHPARLGLVIGSGILAVVASFSGISALSGGRREFVSGRWLFAPLFCLALALAYLPPYADRHDFWTLDGDLVRYLGLAASVQKNLCPLVC